MKIEKKLFRAGPYSDYFSQGVRVGNILTLAGQLGDGKDGKIPESIKEQMENCYRNIQNVLKEFGASLDNVIDETWFVTDMQECMNNVDEIFTARERIYGCKPEVSQTLVGTSALVSAVCKIEIKCIAAL
jgi:enamine deaminase RidA (YjgF/YER057c/UK114 family)|tara:strand:+ start:124 stop:513 length:390 start_codon:yes stop_codon:yes gene_type:complete